MAKVEAGKRRLAEWLRHPREESRVRRYEEHEGIKLENVAENPGRKAIAKMIWTRNFNLRKKSAFKKIMLQCFTAC